jgi:hypothetical protein
MTKPELKLIVGGGDVVAAIDEIRQRAVDGKVDGLVIVASSPDGFIGWAWAYKDDMAYPWARLLGGVISAGDEMRTEGL